MGITDKLLEPQGPLPKGGSRLVQLDEHTSLIIELARLGRLRRDVDAYLVRLLGLWYHSVLAFFHVGDGTGGAVHLVLGVNVTVSERNGEAIPGDVQCNPGNFGFQGGAPAFSAGSLLSACHLRGADTSAGIVHANNVASDISRPVFNSEWPKHILAGHSAFDGLSERVAAEAVALRARVPIVIDSLAASSLDKGMEQLQTQWCWDWSWVADKSLKTWSYCCDGDGLRNACWPPQLARYCCFPQQSFCPPWLAVPTMILLTQVILATARVQGTPQQAEEAFQQELDRELKNDALTKFCHPEKEIREARATSLCNAGSLPVLCKIRSTSQILGHVKNHVNSYALEQQ